MSSKIRVIDQDSGTNVLLKAHSSAVCDLSFFVGKASQPGDLLASVSVDGTLSITRHYGANEDGKEVAKFDPILYVQGVPGAAGRPRIAWHPTDPDQFAVTSGDKNAIVYLVSISSTLVHHETETILDADKFWKGPTVSPLTWHEKSVNDLAFSPDGTCLASCSDDGHVVLWNVDSKKLARDFIPYQNNPVTSVFFCPPLSGLVICLIQWTEQSQIDRTLFFPLVRGKDHFLPCCSLLDMTIHSSKCGTR